MKKTLVIIPHYNKLLLLKECLLHLQRQTTENFDIMLIDNGSNDGSPEYIFNLSEKDDRYKYILNSENLGFASAVNEGIEYSLEHGYEYSLLLNNDAYVADDFVENLNYAISKSKKLFAVSSLMINYHDKDKIDSFGDNFCALGWAFQNKIAEPIDNIKDNEKCFSACGGASIYNNNAFKKIGLFDETFFAYLEDVDIAYRAKLHGYYISTCKDAKCYHLGSATTGSKYNEFKVRTSARNNVYLLYKNMPLVQIIINILPLTLGFLIKQIFFIYKGFGLDYIFGLFDAFKNINVVEKVDFRKINIINLIFIEIELICNIFKYVSNFAKRHL